MKYLKLFETFINEGVSDIVYHFTSSRKCIEILKENTINLTPVFGTKSDSEINKGKLYALSTTTSRNSGIGYAQSLPKKNLVRLELDGRKLNQNYKSTSVDYWQKPKDPNDPLWKGSKEHGSILKDISRADELEDRIISDKESVKPANKYISKISVLDGDDTLLGNMKLLADELEIPFYAYTDQKHFDHSLTSKAINVEHIPLEDSEKRHSYHLSDLIAYYLYNNEEETDNVYDYYIENSDLNIDNLDKEVKKKHNDLKYYLRPNDDFYLSEKAITLENDIHNYKSNPDKNIRYIIRKIGLDMKKNGVTTVKEYLKSKIYKGKKTQEDFNKEFNDSMNKTIDDSYSENLSKGYSTYDKDGNYVDNMYLFTEVKEFLDNEIKAIKKLTSDYILNNDDMYRYYYTISNSEIIDSLDINKSSSRYQEISSLFEDGEYIIRVIQQVVYDIDDYAYNKIQEIKKENEEQWKTN